MKQLWLHLVRAYIRLGLFFYYKKIIVINVENVPKTDAVLLLANHQNALLDALLIATKSGRFSYFLTRASVFQNAFFSKILKSLLMLPVYRMRDGWQNLSKNNAIFDQSAKLLANDNALVIFPEGSHNIKRTVRPLSKGFTRIIFETFEQFSKTKLQLVPVGLNFIQAERFGDSVSIYFGKPIQTSPKVIINKAKSTVDLRFKVHNSLCELTTHIESENYDADLKKLENLQVDFLKPEAVNDCLKSDFKNCEQNESRNRSAFKKVFKFFLILLLLGPYFIWKWAIEPKVKEIEFLSTFRFAIAISLVPIYMLALTFLLLILFGFKLAFGYVLAVLAFTLLAIKL